MRSTSSAPVGVKVLSTAFGWVGMAWSERGLLAITLPQPTEQQALCQLPATLSSGQSPAGLDVDILVDKLRRYFAGDAVSLNEPLDPTVGTGFWRKVWAITRAIPRGQTLTYGEIARMAGAPRSARAVGQAMAHNPWPPIVPCHRVLGSNGQLTGFGGGLAMKRRMLEMEGAIPVDQI